MARMFPSPLPSTVRDDPGRAAECLVYDALATGLPDSIAVSCSVPLLVTRRDGGARDAEIDFIVADPARGLLVLEVKGGAIGFDGATGQWTSTDRYGTVHGIHDPIEQARDGHHELLRQAGRFPGWGPTPVCGAYGVVFPDVQPGGGTIRLDLPRAILVCAEDFRWLPVKLEAIFRYWHPSPVASGLDVRRIRLLEATLAPQVTLRRALAATVREGEEEILRLTEEQFDRLDMLSRHHRARICGGAGTGKTVLALEKARRFAAAGHRTLLTCYNRPLADHLRRCAGDSPLVVKTFLQLCYELGQRAGLDLPDPAGPPPPREYFESGLPNALYAALTRLPDERFDAIVVDEGQDFRPTWWTPLQFVLADPDCGILYVFDDDNQRIYTEASGIPQDLPVFPLTRNLRNTRTIHAVARSFYSGTLQPAGPEGRPVEYVAAADPIGVERETSRVLHRLLRDEGVAPCDIAVLTGHALQHSSLGRDRRIGAFACTQDQTAEPDAVLLETIHRFKGLERPVVVLVNIDDQRDRDQLLYVGLSRARIHLAVIAHPETLAAIRHGGTA